MGKSLPCQNAGVDHTLPHPSPGDKCASPKQWPAALQMVWGTDGSWGSFPAALSLLPVHSWCWGDTEHENCWGERQVMDHARAGCLMPGFETQMQREQGRCAASRDSRNRPSEDSAMQLKVKSGCSLKKPSNLCGGDS